MSERTDERTDESEVDVDEILDDDFGNVGDIETDDPEGVTADDDSGDVGLEDEDLGVDVDALTGGPGGSLDGDGDETGGGDASAESKSGLRSRLTPDLGSVVGNPLSALPSARSFGITFAVTLLAMLVFGFFVPLGSVGSLLGIFAAAAGFGLLSGRRRYLALVVAGGAGSAGGLLLDVLVFSIATGSSVPLAAVGAGAGAVTALVGHYVGRDVRDGLTRDLDT